MKKSLALILFFISTQLSFGQRNFEEVKDSIMHEAEIMYRSEMASWYGTDIFLDKFKDQKDNIGGYFSYANRHVTNCVFFGKSEVPEVLATIQFDSSFSVNSAVVDSQRRSFTEYEKELYTIRYLALNRINNDTLFKTYKDTRLNLIPLIHENHKEVYILTGPNKSGFVAFGNDYLLTFDKHDTLINPKRLHNNIIFIDWDRSDSAKDVTFHTHLPETGDLITSTDICTLMLYNKIDKWKQHYVVSKSYISIWDCQSSSLAFITREAWDKINKDPKK